MYEYCITWMREWIGERHVECFECMDEWMRCGWTYEEEAENESIIHVKCFNHNRSMGGGMSPC